MRTWHQLTNHGTAVGTLQYERTVYITFFICFLIICDNFDYYIYHIKKKKQTISVVQTNMLHAGVCLTMPNNECMHMHCGRVYGKTYCISFLAPVSYQNTRRKPLLYPPAWHVPFHWVSLCHLKGN